MPRNAGGSKQRRHMWDLQPEITNPKMIVRTRKDNAPMSHNEKRQEAAQPA